MRSDAAKKGLQQAPHRSLWNALGMTKEEMAKPLVAVVSSYNEIVPGHMHGTKTSNLAIAGCDLLIAAGVRFSDRDTGKTSDFAKNAKILQLDIDPAEINKNVIVDASVIGDLKEILRRLLPMVKEEKHSQWIRETEERKKKFPLKYDRSGLTGPYVIEKIYELTKGNAIMRRMCLHRWPSMNSIWRTGIKKRTVPSAAAGKPLRFLPLM